MWYRVRGKKRRPRVIAQPGRDADHPARSESASEAPARERTEVKARRTSNPGGREGHGEGRLGPQLPLSGPGERAGQ